MDPQRVEQVLNFVVEGRLDQLALEPAQVDLDDEFDFLTEVDQPAESVPSWQARKAPGEPRRDVAAQWVALFGDASAGPSQPWVDALEMRLADGPCDAEGVWVALAALSAAEGDANLVDHGPVSQMLHATLNAGGTDELELGALSVGLIGRYRASSLQVDVATWLHRNADGSAFDVIESTLLCLAEIGDGRCVRAMEALLMDRPASMSEHQCWRARHIVQLIRRDHRR